MDEPKVTSAAETKLSSDMVMAPKKEEKAESKTKKDQVTKEAAVDKELLQACSQKNVLFWHQPYVSFFH